MTKTQHNARESGTFGFMVDNFFTYVRNLNSGKSKSLATLWFIGAAILATLASIPFIDTKWYLYVQTFVGFPAGVLLFGALTIVIEKTKLKNNKIFSSKNKYSYIQRLRTATVTTIILIALFILIGTYIPYGVGGSITVATIFALYLFIRRTPNELKLAKLGIADPRDIQSDGTIPVEAALDLTANNDVTLEEQQEAEKIAENLRIQQQKEEEELTNVDSEVVNKLKQRSKSQSTENLS